MNRGKDGLPLDKISRAALMLDQDDQHLPTQLDKIRPSLQVQQEQQALNEKYVTRSEALQLRDSESFGDENSVQRKGDKR